MNSSKDDISVMEDLTRFHPQTKLILSYLIQVLKNIERIEDKLQRSAFEESKKLLEMIILRIMSKGFFHDEVLDPLGTYKESKDFSIALVFSLKEVKI